MPASERLNSIQAMRGVAALLVVLYHARDYLNGEMPHEKVGDFLFGYGYIGVDLFFIISGFIITYVTYNNKRDGGLSYITKRFFKIYPPFIVALLSACILRGLNFDTLQLTGGFTLDNIIKSALFIPINFNTPPYIATNLLPVAWTITYELIFYAIFFAAMQTNHKLRGLLTAFIIILLFLVSSLGRGVIDFSPGAKPMPSKFISLITNPIMLTFVLGIISNWLFFKIRNVDRNIVNAYSTLTILAAIVLILSGKFTGHGLLGYGLISFLIFISTMLLIEINGVNIPRPILFLGEISYSLYLSHMVIILTIDKYKERFPLFGDTHGFSKFASVVIASIFFAYILYILIEKPCVHLSRLLLKKRGLIKASQVSTNSE